MVSLRRARICRSIARASSASTTCSARGLRRVTNSVNRGSSSVGMGSPRGSIISDFTRSTKRSAIRSMSVRSASACPTAAGTVTPAATSAAPASSRRGLFTRTCSPSSSKSSSCSTSLSVSSCTRSPKRSLSSSRLSVTSASVLQGAARAASKPSNSPISCPCSQASKSSPIFDSE